MADPTTPPYPLLGRKSALVADLERVALRDRWGLALMAVGWSHLAFFLGCQVLDLWPDTNHAYYLLLWVLEFAFNLVLIGRIAGRGWHRSTPLAVILVRVWATFLILSFNLTSLNTLTGWTLSWFKPALATLSTFGFATMAYLINPWFFAFAVQMYFTGLLIALDSSLFFLIYGLSWWAPLQVIGLILERRRARALDATTRPDRDAFEPGLLAESFDSGRREPEGVAP